MTIMLANFETRLIISHLPSHSSILWWSYGSMFCNDGMVKLYVDTVNFIELTSSQLLLWGGVHIWFRDTPFQRTTNKYWCKTRREGMYSCVRVTAFKSGGHYTVYIYIGTLINSTYLHVCFSMLFYHCGKGVARWVICTSQCSLNLVLINLHTATNP